MWSLWLRTALCVRGQVSLKRDYLGRCWHWKIKFPLLCLCPRSNSLPFCLRPAIVVLREAQCGARILLWANYIPTIAASPPLLDQKKTVNCPVEDSILRPPPQPPSSASSCPFRWSGGQGEHTQRAARTHLDGYGAPEEAGARRGDRLLPAVCLRAVCVRGEASVLVHRAPETLPWLHTGREQVSQANKPALTSIVILTCSFPKQWIWRETTTMRLKEGV